MGSRRAAALAAASVLWVVLAAASSTAARASSSAASPQRAATDFRIPLSFEENAGQADSAARFVARGDGFQLALTPSGARLDLRSPDGAPAAFALLLAGGAGGGRAGMHGLDVLPGVSHYYLGNDPSRWVEGVRHYARVRYDDVYPGISAVFYARGRELEYDLEVRAGADPSVVALRLEGERAVRIDEAGDLVAEVGSRTIVLRAPASYQMTSGGRVAVESAYRIDADGLVRIDVGAYDRSRELIIDPVLSYVTYLGGVLGERVGDLAVDAAGNVYVTGYTFSADFPATGGAVKGGGSDLFVTRLNAAGNAVISSTFIGGSGNESDGRVTVDGAGNVYVSGVTGSANFPVLSAAQPTFAGGLDFTMTKLSAAGTLVYSTYMGGSSIEIFADGMDVDASGAAYLVGQTVSTNYPTTNAAWDETCGTNGSCNGGFDGVITKLSASGSSIVYSSYIGGSNNDFTIDVDVDAAGSAYVVGMTKSTDLPTTAGAVQPSYTGDSGDTAFDGGDAYLVKLSPAGDAAVYSTYIGGTDDDGAFGVAVDAAGSAYVVGATTSTDFPATAGAFQTTFAGGVGGGSLGIPGQFVGGDGFVAKLAAAGDSYIYATYVGGSANDKMNRVALRGASAYVSGEVRSNDMPTVNPIQATYGGGDFDGYVFRLDSAGSALLGATYIGGSDDLLANGGEIANGVAVDAAGDVYVGGGTSASDLPATPSALQSVLAGNANSLGDGWVAKVHMADNPYGAPPDHYLCYKARGRPGLEPIGLPIADDIESLNFEVKRRSVLCAPADRERHGTAFPSAHLVDYSIKRVIGSPPHVRETGIEVTNQVGTFSYDTTKESGLLLPSGVGDPLSPDAHPLDRYKCYRVKASPGAPKLASGTEIDLDSDLDEPAAYTLRKPSRLCVPADVDSLGVRNPAGHLMCYKAKRTAGSHVRVTGLHVSNEFEDANPEGPGVLDTTKVSEVCVPSVLGPIAAPVCGDDEINQAAEQCDGTDDLACPGVLCQPDCTCAPAGVCGNNLTEAPTEQCDGSDDGACPGECTSLCACLGARTFTIDPATSQAQTSLGVNVPLSGSVDFVFHDEVAPGALVFDVPIVALPGVDLGGFIGTICPFLAQDPDLPPGIAGRGVLNCSGTDLGGTGFFESPTLTQFQDHCVEGVAAGFCDSAPNPGGGVLHGASGVFVPDGIVDPACSLPGYVVDDHTAHGGGCNGPSILEEGGNPYLPGDATLSLNVILDRRASGAGCAPPVTPGASAVTVNFTTGSKQGGIMDLNATPASVFGFALTGAPFDCSQFLIGEDPTGASIVGVFTAIDAPLIGELEFDIVSSIEFAGEAGP